MHVKCLTFYQTLINLSIMDSEVITFTRQKNYVLRKELGQGACGKTVLLYDDVIGEQFVCKKYSPLAGIDQKQYFQNFLLEIKLLYLVYHPNIVRIFNYYIYPEQTTGFILMEFINGKSIDQFLNEYPEKINEIFSQVILGFSYLEQNKILHRDIRPQNIMVTDEGVVKIIDLGFGKRIQSPGDFDKSISLNWRYEPPDELLNGLYNFQTEVYFVAKLFEAILHNEQIQHFKYNSFLHKMLEKSPHKREASFLTVNAGISQGKFEIDFDGGEKAIYIDFADGLSRAVNKIAKDTNYLTDVDRICTRLEDLYKRVLLEESIPNISALIGCFLDGNYYYNRSSYFQVGVLKSFLNLLDSCSRERKNIIINNLHSRLDSIERYNEIENDEIPF